MQPGDRLVGHDRRFRAGLEPRGALAERNQRAPADDNVIGARAERDMHDHRHTSARSLPHALRRSRCDLALRYVEFLGTVQQ